MAWYTAELLYRAEVDSLGDCEEQLLEHRYFLLIAPDDQIAEQKALELAKAKQHSYLNQSGSNVKWVFEKVIDIKEIIDTELDNGTEIYHKYFSRPRMK